jgi:flagellar biosynthesis/type III secretory pathway chaperone
VSALIDHLRTQVGSAQRLLQVLLAQRDSIRKQDVEGVLARLGDVQAELAVRERIERERDGLLRSVGSRLGVAPEALHLDDLLDGIAVTEAHEARSLSAELKGLLSEIADVHQQNRVLIRQELSFLDHLLRVLSGTPQAGYSASGGFASAAPTFATVDSRA